ncbi:MAG: site-specific integrase, partial [Clostridium sp.]|nr:site-specific integrase [Clostridium sp.]
RMVMSLAVKEGLLRENPADQDHIPLPKADRKEKDVLDAEEAREFARCALAENDPRTKLMVILYLYTGMRMGELCGLEWKDVDFAGKTISIQRTSVYVPGKRLVTKEPESMDSRRVIQADPLVFSVLEEYRNWYLGQQELKSGEWVHSDRLFIRSDGSPVTPNSTALWLDKFTARWNLRRVTSLTLRSACSILQTAAGTEGVE